MSVSASPADRPLAAEVAEFALGLRLGEIPPEVRRHVAWLLVDHAAVCMAGRPAPAAAIAADHAGEAHGGTAATSLLDGRRLSAVGAAWANGVLANVLDYDDGHRITKGHPGGMVIPAALAAAEAVGADLADLVAAVVVGYEVAIRAGIRLHERERDYHASGAWGSLGAAAAVGRLLGLDGERLLHAVGLAEYHAPIALIMRSVADPAMTKDAVGWGAMLGVSSAQLAGRGFTALGSTFLESGLPMGFGQRWCLQEAYIKPYPCCRWTQPAIAAAVSLLDGRPLDPAEIDRVTIDTFEAAEGLSLRRPRTTEDMQYSLVWPVAVALVDGDFDVDGVLGEPIGEPVAGVADCTTVRVDPEMTRQFPARRVSRVTVALRDGSVLDSGVVEAPGEPGEPGWHQVIEGKARRYLGWSRSSPAVTMIDPPPLPLADRGHDQLVSLLAYGLGTVVDVRR